jgi:hypothetical protein
LVADIWDVAGDRWDAGVFHPMCTYLTVSATRWLDRSETYPRIAEAFGAQWGGYLAQRVAA